ncbi:phage tail tape measure protein [Staphylococcus xylosus]|uniref:phage tail tape measure protein n=1 Tax=Staphylococcus xylosus TaxID=1288 RepID=UPI002DB8B2EB|nr:phage tail tape measure protein [Staphylococcus xylosus]MEB8101058.1 phage tail tape measure protein [Staphylococcus xylosus]
MAEKLQGLVIELGLDHMNVDEGLKGLKRQLGVVNSEMRANLSAFDKSEKSMDQYSTKIQGLNQKLKVQKQMFNQVEDELKQVNTNYIKAKERVSDVEKAYKQLTEANRKNKTALDKSTDALKASNAELKKSENAYKRTTQSKQNAYEKLKQLRQAEKDLKNSNQATTAQLKRASEATQRQANKHKELVQRYKEEGAQVAKLKEQNKSLSASNDKVKATYDKTNTELEQTEKEFNNLNSTIKNHSSNLSKAQNAVNNERASLNNLEKTISKTKNEMKAFNKEQLIANSSFTKAAQRADDMGNKFGNVGTKMTDMGRNMTVGVTTPITLGLGAAIKKSADFEQQMSRVGAVSQASGSDLKVMSAQAVDLGAKTSKSASEVAEGMNELAQLGFSAKQVMSAMPGVISAAEASGADMATTAQVMASSMNAFNIKAKDSGHVADMLATAANDSAADIEYMGEALKYAGTPAHSLGVTMEDTSAAIEVMSNSGLKGEQAGTVLRASFIRLAKPTGEAAKKMKEMGIHLSDSKGKFVGMGSLIGQFKSNLQGMTKEQKLATVSQIVGTEAASGFLSLIDAGPTKINKYSKSLKNSDGASKKAADQMKKNLKGALEQLGGAFESLGIQIGKDLTPMIQAGAKGLQRFVEGFSGLPGWVRKGAIGLGIFAAATGPVLIATGLVIGAIGKAAKGYASLNRQMAINTAEAAVNAGANKAAAGSLATTGKATKGQQGTFGKLGNVLAMTTGRYGKLGKAVKVAGGILGKLTVPLTIATTIFGVAYEKIGWFRQGFADMGKIVNQVGKSIDFSWVGKITKDISGKWEWLKKDMARGLQEGALFKGIKVGFDGLHKAVSKASDTTNVFAGKVSKGTKKALGSYNNLSEKATTKLNELRISHKKIGDKEFNQIKSLYGNINKEVTKQLDKRHDSEINGLTKIFNATSGLSKKEEAKILAQTKTSNRKESSQAKRVNEQILGIYAKAHREKRSLTKSENDKIAKLQTELDKTVVKSLSKGEVEQKAILERMKQNKGKLSMQAASNVIKESAKERDTTIKDAKKKYNDTVAEAVRQRDETGTLSKSQADKVIKDAKTQYDESKAKAKKQHKDVVDQAQKQNKGVKKNIDAQTGTVKSKWQVMLDTTTKKGKKMYHNTVGFFKDTHNGANKWWGKLGKKIGDKSKDAYDGAKKWWSKTKSNTVNNSKDAHNGSGKWWTKLGSKISGKSKDIFGNVRKWWSKTKSNTVNNSKDAHNGSGKWWNKLGSKISGKSKDIFGSVKKWWNRTKNNAVNNSKDTHGGTSNWWNKIGSKIAGKSKDIFGSVRKWWNKTKSNAVNNSKDAHGGTSNWWNKIGDKISSKSRNSYDSAKKWFGKMKDNVKDRLWEMWDKAKLNFGKIADEGENKSKKTHGSWKSWLGKTLDFLKNIKTDFGTAASNLGKSVANKAIDGLNGMIGGINKIAKAITDKNLIKPITPLSTGTFNGSSVATDSEGGLAKPTLAVVNDRGQGNAPGGGTQEVIERADGSFYAPKGRDVVVGLGIGDKVHNATDTKRYQDMGILPRFSTGTKKKKKLQDVIGDKVISTAGDLKDGASDAAHGIKKNTEKGLEKAADLKDKGVSWLGDAFGDVMDWIDKPGKLVNKVFDSLGLSFGGGANATVTMAKGAYSKLKESFIEKVKSMFDEVGGGDGDAAWLFKHDIWQKFGAYKGLSFNGGQHYGMDFGMLPNTNVYAVAGGKASRVWHDYGGGNSIEIDLGNGLTNWYMHLNKQLVKQGQRVKTGDLIAKSGNTGAFTAGTGHLHFQLNDHGKPKDPEQWLKNLGSKGGGKGESYARSVIQQAQGILGGRYKGSHILNNMMRLAKRESNYDSKAVNNWDSNAQAGHPSKGLFQMIDTTFASNAKKGYSNFSNPVHQAISAMQYIQRRYGWGGFPRAAAYAYENGGISTKHKVAELSEKNRAEAIIPLHRTKRTRAIQLIEQAMNYVGMDKGKTNVTVNNDNSTVEKLLQQIAVLTDKGNKATEALTNVLKTNNNSSNPRALQQVEKLISQESGNRSNGNNYMAGVAIQ